MGPTLWKVAMTPIYVDFINTKTFKVVTYKDDILVMIGAARPPLAFKRTKNHLDNLLVWAERYGLKFSAQKKSAPFVEKQPQA